MYRTTIYSFLILLCTGITGQAATGPAQIVSLRPSVRLYVKDVSEPAVVGRTILSGNRLETDAHGRLSILLPDHGLLKIAGDTSFVYQQEDEGQIRLNRGKLWMRALFKAAAFLHRPVIGLQTPTAVVGVRGTEWYTEVAPDGTTTVGIVDGTVDVSNRLGAVQLGPREMAVVRPGRAPVKSAYLTPKNAVNWTLQYRGFWDESDYYRAGPVLGPMIRKAVAAFGQNDVAAGFDILQESRSAYGRSGPWNALAGFLELVSGNDIDARRYFSAAAAADPTWALPYAHMALMDLVENRHEDARKNGARALNAEPDSAVALIAAAYVSKGGLDMDRAYATARKAVERSPRFEAAVMIAATLALEVDDHQYCQHLLASLPAQTGVEAERRMLSGYLNLRRGRHADAADDFTTAVALDPEQSDAWMGLGIARFNLGQTEAGMDAMIKASLIAPRISSIQSYLAKAYFEQDRETEGLASLARAKRLDPKDPTPFLYESLWLHSRHRPGLAIRQLYEARKRNDHRAVFRSRYLLDQDQGVLMSNAAAVYHTLGFEQASVQQAAQAIALDPANQGAHRRLYFSLLFDPVSYQQAGESAKLLAKMFAPPTRKAVVLDEQNLSPYQEMFAPSGVDGVFDSRFFYSKDQHTTVKTPQNAVAMAGKLDIPLAYSAQINTGRSQFGTQIESVAASEYFSSTDRLETDQDIDTLVFSGLVKWQPSPPVSLFADGRYVDLDIDLERNQQTSLRYTGGIPGGDTVSSGWSRNTGRQADFDTGIHLDLSNGAHCFFHISYHDAPASSQSLDTTASPYYGYDSTGGYETNDTHRIVQGALWKIRGNHFFQLGMRRFDQEQLTDAESTIYGTTTRAQTRDRVALSTAYFYHQLRWGPDVTWIWGVSADESSYTAVDRRSHRHGTVNPVAGVTWDMSPNWRLRAAHIQNAAGDRNERLQPALVAGFPLFRVNNVLDAYTTEQLSNLRYQSSVVGLDFKLTDYPFFCGVEAGTDKIGSDSFDPGPGGGLLHTDNDLRRIGFYLESLIHDDLSGSIAYRHIAVEYPEKQYQNQVDCGLAYFFDNGLAIRLKGGYANQRPDAAALQPIIKETYRFAPELDWYLSSNKFRLNITGAVAEECTRDTSDQTVDNNTTRRLTASATWYF